MEPRVDAEALFNRRWLMARLGLQEAGAPFLQAVGTLPGLKLGGSAATDEPLLKLGFPLVHQEELSQQDISLWRGHRKVLSYALPPPVRGHPRKPRSRHGSDPMGSGHP